MSQYENALQKIGEFQHALEQAQAIDSLIEKAMTAKNFAIVTKNDITFFVVMSEQQALAVNGDSIPLDSIPGISDAIKKISGEALAQALAIHKAKLDVLDKLNPLKQGVSAAAAVLKAGLPGAPTS